MTLSTLAAVRELTRHLPMMVLELERVPCVPL
jgi:hypothetical protein